MRDCRFAARALRRTPGFTLVAVASLACGFALATATAAIVHAYSVRALPYPSAERLYRVIYADAGQPEPRGIGRRIRTADPTQTESPPTAWRTIVGIAGDVRQTHTDTDLRDLYVPFLQAPTRYAQLYVRTEDPTGSWLEHVRSAVGELDPDVLVSARTTAQASLSGEADRQLAGPRFLMSVLTGFAAFAVFLAVLGIYGVTAYSVQQREREIAIRTAVGADRRSIVRMILRDSGGVLMAGITFGVAGALAGGRLLETQLHGVGPLDPTTLLAACTALGTAGLLAVWWPARRAAAASPLAALVDE